MLSFIRLPSAALRAGSSRALSASSPAAVRVVIKNLGFKVTAPVLEEILSVHGVRCSSVAIAGTEKRGGLFWSKGYAFGEVPEEDLQRAIDLTGTDFEGRPVEILRATSDTQASQQ